MGDGRRVWLCTDPERPAYGVRITYGNGLQCDSKPVARKTEIFLVCNSDVRTFGGEATRVEEVQDCTYNLFYRTAYGCPAGTCCCVSVEKGSSQA